MVDRVSLDIEIQEELTKFKKQIDDTRATLVRIDLLPDGERRINAILDDVLRWCEEMDVNSEEELEASLREYEILIFKASAALMEEAARRIEAGPLPPMARFQ